VAGERALTALPCTPWPVVIRGRADAPPERPLVPGELASCAQKSRYIISLRVSGRVLLECGVRIIWAAVLRPQRRLRLWMPRGELSVTPT